MRPLRRPHTRLSVCPHARAHKHTHIHQSGQRWRGSVCVRQQIALFPDQISRDRTSFVWADLINLAAWLPWLICIYIRVLVALARRKKQRDHLEKMLIHSEIFGFRCAIAALFSLLRTSMLRDVWAECPPHIWGHLSVTPRQEMSFSRLKISD